MAKKKNDQLWTKAKKRCRLNVATIEMSKEMGLNPKSLIKNIPSKSQQWKAPVSQWVQDMYAKRYGEEKLLEKLKEFNCKIDNYRF